MDANNSLIKTLIATFLHQTSFELVMASDTSNS